MEKKRTVNFWAGGDDFDFVSNVKYICRLQLLQNRTISELFPKTPWCKTSRRNKCPSGFYTCKIQQTFAPRLYCSDQDEFLTVPSQSIFYMLSARSTNLTNFNPTTIPNLFSSKHFIFIIISCQWIISNILAMTKVSSFRRRQFAGIVRLTGRDNILLVNLLEN